MNALTLVFVAICLFAISYRIYSVFLANKVLRSTISLLQLDTQMVATILNFFRVRCGSLSDIFLAHFSEQHLDEYGEEVKELVKE